MKNLLLAAVFIFGTAVAANAQTPDPKTADVKAKSCCASKADKAQCAEMKAQAQADNAEADKKKAATASADRDPAKPACCAAKKEASKPCTGRTVAEAKEDL